MSEAQTQRFWIDDGGEKLEIVLYSPDPVELEPSDPPLVSSTDEDEWESKGATEVAIASLQEIHQYIRSYARYTIGAFKNFAGAEIEEMNVKFGLKVAGKSGIPMLAGSGAADFEVSIKCKFPDKGNKTENESTR